MSFGHCGGPSPPTWSPLCLVQGCGMTDQTITINSTQAAWMFVGATFHRGSGHCEECDYCSHHEQIVGVGEARGTEHWTECDLGKRSHHVPEMCPAYLARLQETAEEC